MKYLIYCIKIPNIKYNGPVLLLLLVTDRNLSHDFQLEVDLSSHLTDLEWDWNFNWYPWNNMGGVISSLQWSSNVAWHGLGISIKILKPNWLCLSVQHNLVMQPVCNMEIITIFQNWDSFISFQKKNLRFIFFSVDLSMNLETRMGLSQIKCQSEIILLFLWWFFGIKCNSGISCHLFLKLLRNKINVVQN